MRFEKLYPLKTPADRALDKAKENQQAAIFEDQWSHPTTVEMGEERIKAYDIRPADEKTPVPTLLVPGWDMRPAALKENIKTLVEAGRRTISADAPHGVEHRIKREQSFGEVADAELRRIAAFMGALDAAGVQKADAIGHSEGGFDVALAAAMYPERFRNIILVDSNGIIGSDSMASLAVRITWDQLRSIAGGLREGTASARINLLNGRTPTMLLHPKRSFNEVRSLAKANIIDLLAHIKSQGVGVVIVHGADDAAFPMERAQREIERAVVSEVGPRQHVGSRDDERLRAIAEQVVDGVISVKGSHADFIVHAPEYTRLAEGQLTALEARRP